MTDPGGSAQLLHMGSIHEKHLKYCGCCFKRTAFWKLVCSQAGSFQQPSASHLPNGKGGFWRGWSWFLGDGGVCSLFAAQKAVGFWLAVLIQGRERWWLLGLQKRLAMQGKRQVKANHLFPLRAKAAAGSSCTEMMLALLSCTDLDLQLLPVRAVYGNGRNNNVRSSGRARGSLRSQSSAYVSH